MKARLEFMIVLAIITIIPTGCVSSSKYRALEASSSAEQSKLQDEISSLRSQIQDLEKQKSDLSGELAALGREKEKAGTEIATLSTRLTTAQEEAAEIQRQKDAEIARLKGTYETLVKDLKTEIEQGEVKVTQIRDRLTVNMVEKILFDSGRAEVKTQGRALLKKVGEILKNVTDKEIRIEGYTDNVPIGGALRERFATNWELSTQRATNVLRFLQDEAGLDGSRLSAVGYGEFRPVATNDTPEGRAENRRIEIVLAPLDIQDVFKEAK